MVLLTIQCKTDGTSANFLDFFFTMNIFTEAIVYFIDLRIFILTLRYFVWSLEQKLDCQLHYYLYKNFWLYINFKYEILKVCFLRAVKLFSLTLAHMHIKLEP